MRAQGSGGGERNKVRRWRLERGGRKLAAAEEGRRLASKVAADWEEAGCRWPR